MTDTKQAIVDQAWNCGEWPKWLHEIVDDTNEVADRLDMSSEQALAYAVLTALAARDALAAVDREFAKKTANDVLAWKQRAERAEAQLAEAMKALESPDIVAICMENNRPEVSGWVTQSQVQRILEIVSRRAREAQGGSNG